MTQVEVETRLTRLEAEVEALKKKLDDAELIAAVQEGNAQIERGAGLPAVEAIKALGRKNGLK
jgi:uncharacterized protein YlxW (UPF0749 family)